MTWTRDCERFMESIESVAQQSKLTVQIVMEQTIVAAMENPQICPGRHLWVAIYPPGPLRYTDDPIAENVCVYSVAVPPEVRRQLENGCGRQALPEPRPTLAAMNPSLPIYMAR